jgi:hypothetical protein
MPTARSSAQPIISPTHRAVGTERQSDPPLCATTVSAGRRERLRAKCTEIARFRSSLRLCASRIEAMTPFVRQDRNRKVMSRGVVSVRIAVRVSVGSLCRQQLGWRPLPGRRGEQGHGAL